MTCAPGQFRGGEAWQKGSKGEETFTVAAAAVICYSLAAAHSAARCNEKKGTEVRESRIVTQNRFGDETDLLQSHLLSKSVLVQQVRFCPKQIHPETELFLLINN